MTTKTNLQQKIRSSFSIRFLLVAIMLMAFTSVQAQTTFKFSCTDVSKHAEVDEDVYKDLKAEWLGGTGTLTFYDRNLRFSFDGANQVYEKITATQYKCTKTNGYKYVLQLNKEGKTIKSFKVSIYYGNKPYITATFRPLKAKR